VGLDADLIAYYEAEAQSGLRAATQPASREGLRERFAAFIAQREAVRLVDVGCGPGLDVEAWHRDGFEVVGVDLAHANVERVRRLGIAAATGSIYELPFRTGAFDALWTMSTFVHVPRARHDVALAELMRVMRPGSRLAIGTWGGVDFEGVPEFGALRPYRFFSLSSHDRWRSLLDRHGVVVAFDTLASTSAAGWEYQFAILVAPG
jgi:SAM-dependent methyltransferase